MELLLSDSCVIAIEWKSNCVTLENSSRIQYFKSKKFLTLIHSLSRNTIYYSFHEKSDNIEGMKVVFF